ncbi:LD-carboxypeptidase [Candidatus Woesearchaeota archaeon]|jgi:muramoyltetrapeptide carboxypeptidase|nr:LD-carboxypeptidase [Candidatus Woesearchaeota archaeon]MBT6520246.1 LD-carboxypeptidase [Candidatus Woesearchaeota archaeon]MBT7367257.1 LD-carboxypeptidase [Candidatus Woesearchaeota archaeon]
MIPNKLKKGDTICIIAPSNPITQDRKYLTDNAVEFLKAQGFNVVFGDNAFGLDKFGVSGGSPEQRAEDINNAFKDPNINMIWCAHGGDTVNQLLNLIDYNAIKKNPKLFLGMSDIDVLHLAINTMTGLVTFNSSDPKLGRDLDLDFPYTKKCFSERIIEGKIGVIEPVDKRKCLREGSSQGDLIGGNISSILRLAGTKYFPNFKNKILFLEAYRTDVKSLLGQLAQLKNIGVFDQISGIVVGHIHEFITKGPFSQDDKEFQFEDVVLEISKEYDFPILKVNNFGHRCNNAFLPLGCKVELNAKNKSITILEPCVK